MDFFMQFSGYQRICSLFAIGLFTVHYLKGAALVNMTFSFEHDIKYFVMCDSTSFKWFPFIFM